MPATLPSTYGCVNFCRNIKIKYMIPRYIVSWCYFKVSVLWWILIITQSILPVEDLIIRHSCSFLKEERFLYLMSGQKDCELINCASTIHLKEFTGRRSQDHFGWNGPLEVIRSKPSAEARPPSGSHPGPHPDSF